MRDCECTSGLEKLLKCILFKDCEAVVRVYLNSPGNLVCKDLSTDIKLYVCENSVVRGETVEKDIELDVVTKGTGVVDFTAEGTAVIPMLDVHGMTIEKGNVPVEVSTGEEEVIIEVSGSGTATIPPLDIECTTDPDSEDNSCDLCQQEDGCCSYYCNTLEKDIDVDLEGGQAIIKNLISKGEITIPELEVEGNTETAEIPITVEGKGEVEVSSNGIATGTIPSLEVNGVAETKGLPVSGKVDLECNCELKPVSYRGVIKDVACGFVTLMNRITKNEVVVDLRNVIEVSFYGNNSLVDDSTLKDSCHECHSIEERLRVVWGKGGKFKLLGSNTNNPINNVIDSCNIIYIGRNLMIVSKYKNCKVYYEVYNLCNVIGYEFQCGFENWI